MAGSALGLIAGARNAGAFGTRLLGVSMRISLAGGGSLPDGLGIFFGGVGITSPALGATPVPPPQQLSLQLSQQLLCRLKRPRSRLKSPPPLPQQESPQELQLWVQQELQLFPQLCPQLRPQLWPLLQPCQRLPPQQLSQLEPQLEPQVEPQQSPRLKRPRRRSRNRCPQLSPQHESHVLQQPDPAGTSPANQAVVTNKNAAFTGFPPMGLTGAQGRDEKQCRRACALRILYRPCTRPLGPAKIGLPCSASLIRQAAHPSFNSFSPKPKKPRVTLLM